MPKKNNRDKENIILPVGPLTREASRENEWRSWQ
jgi:hypothetical protein